MFFCTSSSSADTDGRVDGNWKLEVYYAAQIDKDSLLLLTAAAAAPTQVGRTRVSLFRTNDCPLLGRLGYLSSADH